jgi:hypothetical protein
MFDALLFMIFHSATYAVIVLTDDTERDQYVI